MAGLQRVKKRADWHRIAVVVGASYLFGLSMLSNPAAAEEVRYSFNLKEGNLGRALNTVADIANVQILFDPALVDRLVSPSLQGRYSRDEALQLLLKETPLVYRVSRSGYVLILKAEAKLTTARLPDDPAPPSKNNLKLALPPEVVVVGIRSGLEVAFKRKYSADQIVDSISAEDIGKLPDSNLAEALQRAAGVQITRENGDGIGIQIRGLSQVIAELNGHPVFTAGIGNTGTPSRNLNFEDFPSELVARADIYKAPVADQIEGGIGGLVDFRTRRSFDFNGTRYGVALKQTASSLADRSSPSFSAYYSTRKSGRLGEMGVWLFYSHQEHAYRNDGAMGAAPNISILANSNRVGFNHAIWMYYTFGQRQRQTINASLQWRPNRDLELFADFNYVTNRTGDKVEHSLANLGVSGSGPEDFQTTFIDIPILAYAQNQLPYVVAGKVLGAPNFGSFIDIKLSHTLHAVSGLKWSGGSWTISGEASVVRSDFDSLFNQIDTTYSPTFVAFDYRTRPGSLSYPVADLLDISRYTITKLNYAHLRDLGTDKSLRGDIERVVSTGPIGLVKGGLRYSTRTSGFRGNNPVNILDVPATNIPWLFKNTRYQDLLRSTGGHFSGPWLVPDVDFVSNPAKTFALFGIKDAVDYDPRQTFDIREDTSAAYLMANYDIKYGAISIDGNFGVRLVQTNLIANGPTIDLLTGQIQSLNAVQSGDDVVLPSGNLRVKFTEKWIVRLAMSKVVARPDFNQLNPALFIANNSLSGYAGNPLLKSLKANQIDASMEYYFAKASFISIAAFDKRVTDFTQDSTRSEIIGGVAFQITRPQSLLSGTIRGIELSYQHFYDSLPPPFNGLGMTANATFIHSLAPDSTGRSGKLPNLSDAAYNLVVIYERRAMSARLAYNWRSAFSTGIGVLQGASFPIEQQAFGQLDGAISLRLSPKLSLGLEGTNLTKASSNQTFVGVHSFATDTDRRLSLGVRYKY